MDYEFDDAAERAAWEDDLAAQNAVDDAKYDYPPQEEPPDGYYDQATHHELAEDLLQASDLAKNEAWSQIKATQAVARAVLALAEATLQASGARETPFSAGFPIAFAPVPLADPDVVRVGSVSPTDPAELGEWLRGLPERSALRDRAGDVWMRGHVGGFADGIWDSPALLFPGTTVARRLAEGHIDIGGLTNHAPFTVLALGDGTQGGA